MLFKKSSPSSSPIQSAQETYADLVILLAHQLCRTTTCAVDSPEESAHLTFSESRNIDVLREAAIEVERGAIVLVHSTHKYRQIYSCVSDVYPTF